MEVCDPWAFCRLNMKSQPRGEIETQFPTPGAPQGEQGGLLEPDHPGSCALTGGLGWPALRWACSRAATSSCSASRAMARALVPS